MQVDGPLDISVKIIEIKYCTDTKPDDQLQRAKEQHLDLVQQLIAHGYLADMITIITLLIGVSGTIYKKHTQEALKSLGVAHTQVKTCVSKAHKEAYQIAARHRTNPQTHRAHKQQQRQPPQATLALG